MTIRVLYSCHACGVVDASIHVPERGEENVIEWMDQTAAIIARDHRSAYPNCRATSIQNLKIPITNVEKIGGPSVQ
jgi:hypothetical protein